MPSVTEKLSDAELDHLVLLKGSHQSRRDGVCLLEAVAWFAGKRHSDQPPCVCPVLGAFGRSWNDGILDDEVRTRVLKPFIPVLVGTKVDVDTEIRRAFLAMDWLVRVHTPAWLDLKDDLRPHAATLRALAPIETTEQLVAAQPTLDAARSAAAAAWDAAWDAAYPVAYAAAKAIFVPVVEQLQQSAAELFTRMIECGRELVSR